MEFTELLSLDDFKWYKLGLDVSEKYHHLHIGEPDHYPCKVVSMWMDNPNGPYEYHHKFVYLQSQVCEQCGHSSVSYPVTEPDTMFD